MVSSSRIYKSFLVLGGVWNAFSAADAVESFKSSILVSRLLLSLSGELYFLSSFAFPVNTIFLMGDDGENKDGEVFFSLLLAIFASVAASINVSSISVRLLLLEDLEGVSSLSLLYSFTGVAYE